MQRRQKIIISLLLTAALFTGVALLVRSNHFGIDRSLADAVHHTHSAFLNQWYIDITALGSALLVLVVAGVFVVTKCIEKQYYAALFMFCTVLGAGILNLLFKQLLHRARPEFWQHLVHEVDYSFPSGHAMLSSALIGALIYLYWQSKQRNLLITIGLLYTLLVGISRVYLGVHYPSDVLGGWLLTTAWILLLMLVLEPRKAAITALGRRS